MNPGIIPELGVFVLLRGVCFIFLILVNKFYCGCNIMFSVDKYAAC